MVDCKKRNRMSGWGICPAIQSASGLVSIALRLRIFMLVPEAANFPQRKTLSDRTMRMTLTLTQPHGENNQWRLASPHDERYGIHDKTKAGNGSKRRLFDLTL